MFFHKTMTSWVDVKDFGAKCDGITNDVAAFEAADAAVNGRELLVFEGVYSLKSNVTFQNGTKFQGSLTMPVSTRLLPTRNYDLGTFIRAFGGDEVQAFKKA